MSDNEPRRQWLAGVIGAGAVALCCALPLIVAGGFSAAVSGVLFGPVGLAVAIATVLVAVGWTTRRRRVSKEMKSFVSRGDNDSR